MTLRKASCIYLLVSILLHFVPLHPKLIYSRTVEARYRTSSYFIIGAEKTKGMDAVLFYFTLVNCDDILIAEDFFGIIAHRADVAANQKRCLHHGGSVPWS